MSVLAYPRIHFKGACWIDPATGNNPDVAVNLDPATVTLLPPLSDSTDDEARAWMLEGLKAVNSQNKKTFLYLRCCWNYYGTLAVEFVKCSVTAVVGRDGQVSTNDALVGAAVRILPSRPGEGPSIVKTPVICDLDPAGNGLTQIFLGGFSLGGNDPKLLALHDTRAYSRWVLWRNLSTHEGQRTFPGAGATWQFAMPKAALAWMGAPASPVLTELAQTVAGDDSLGIVVQFCFYLVSPQIEDAELSTLYHQGKSVSNPAQGLVVGTVGVWQRGELETEPGDRLLRKPQKAEVQVVPAADKAARLLGPATARVQPLRNVVSLNLISTFPEVDYQSPHAKADLGKVMLGYIPAAGAEPITIGGPVPYDVARYNLTSGVVDVGFDPKFVPRSQLQTGTLVLLSTAAPLARASTILTEAHSEIIIQTDDRGVYCEVGDKRSLCIRVRDRGRPPRRDVPLFLWEYQFASRPVAIGQLPYFDLTLVENDKSLQHRINFPRRLVFPAGRSQPLRVVFRAVRPGALALAFTLDGKPVPKHSGWGTVFYAGVRVMPSDDFSTVDENVRLSWPFIYKHLFRYYHLVFPAMSRVIPFDSQQAMENRSSALVTATDPDRWKSTHYMPISRDLSRGKRSALVEWDKKIRAGRTRSPRPGQ